METVRQRLARMTPAAIIGHRGTGRTRPGHPFPENAIASFREAVRQGAHGIELDLALTADGALVVMHDDTLDRTTNGSGRVNQKTLAQIRACRILDAGGRPTGEPPPTLEEVYAALPPDILVNVELKTFGQDGRTESARPAAALARAAVRAVVRLGAAGRTFFSSFDEHAAAAVKQEAPSLYAALLLDRRRSLSWENPLAKAVDLSLDAVHPHVLIPVAGVEAALRSGLQVNVYTVNDRPRMNALLDRGVTSLITDQPGLLRTVIRERQRLLPEG